MQVPEGKGENTFAFDAQWLGAAEALGVIEATHRQWQRTIDARLKLRPSRALYGEAALTASAVKSPWLPPPGWVPHAPTTQRAKEPQPLA